MTISKGQSVGKSEDVSSLQRLLVGHCLDASLPMFILRGNTSKYTRRVRRAGVKCYGRDGKLR